MTTVVLPVRRSTRGLVYLIASQVISLASLLPWMMVLVLLQPEAGQPLSVTLFSVAVVAYPLLPLVCAVAAWMRWRRGRTLQAVVWSTAPLVIALPLVVVTVAVMTGSLAYGVDFAVTLAP